MSSSGDNLLEQAVRGDRTALGQLLEQEGSILRQRLSGEIPARWQSVLSADDVMQQTYIDAFLGIRRFAVQGGEVFTAWLTTIAKRNLLDAVQMLEADKRGGDRHRVQPGADDDSYLALYELLGSARSTPSKHAARVEARRCLEEAILQLPPAYREVVRMYDLEGRPVEEVAAVLNRSPGAVFMLRARAHRRLKESMGTASRYLSDSS